MSHIIDVVLSGLKTTHKSYARAVHTNGEDHQDAPKNETCTLETQVVQFIEAEMDIKLENHEIVACHSLKGKKEIPDIIMRVTNRKTKTKLFRSARTLKGTQVFFNEHLTKKNAMLARTARTLRKNGQIMNTWTRNCKVFIKMQDGRVLF